MKRGPYKDRAQFLEQTIALRKQGYGYGTIGRKLNIPPMTIRRWVSDISSNKRTAQRMADQKRWEPSLEESKTRATRKKAIIRDRGRKCEECGLEEWLGVPIPLDLHHIDGIRQNDSKENLRLLCPNCHALTANYCGKNIGKNFALVAQLGRRRFIQNEDSGGSNPSGGTKFVRRPFSGLQGNWFGKAVAEDRNHWLLLVNANSSEGSFDSITEVPYNV